MQPSSKDLHPKTGARFVFDRMEDAEAEVGDRYRVVLYLPEGRTWSGRLHWDEAGAATLEPESTDSQASPDDEALTWARAETLKLARVLRRAPKAHMVRWRGP